MNAQNNCHMLSQVLRLTVQLLPLSPIICLLLCLETLWSFHLLTTSRDCLNGCIVQVLYLWRFTTRLNSTLVVVVDVVVTIVVVLQTQRASWCSNEVVAVFTSLATVIVIIIRVIIDIIIVWCCCLLLAFPSSNAVYPGSGEILRMKPFSCKCAKTWTRKSPSIQGVTHTPLGKRIIIIFISADYCPERLSHDNMDAIVCVRVDPTFGILSHKTLDAAQPRHLLKPNWKPSSSHTVFDPTNISTQFLLQ